MRPLAHIDPDNATQTVDAGSGPCECTLVSVYVPSALTEGDGVSIVLPDGRVATLVVQSAEDAQSLAAARIARGDSALYVADCRPIATAAADALVAAGMGGS